MRRIPSRLWALVVLSAVLQWLPFPLAGPVPLWRRLFCWVCLTPLLFALNGNDSTEAPLSPGQAALLGYVCGVIWYLGNCYWVYQTMFRYGGLPPLASAGVLLLFALYLGIYLGLFGVLFGLTRRYLGQQAALGLSAFLWVGCELARARITGFPWDLLGYSQVDNSLLTPFASIGGVMGLSLIVALANALWLWRPRPAFRFVGPACGGVILLLHLAGSLHTDTSLAAPETAVLLQENLGVGAQAGDSRESEQDMVRNFATYTASPRMGHDLSRRHIGTPEKPPAIVVWPEAPTSFADADPQLRRALGGISRNERAPLVVDAVGRDVPRGGSERGQEFVSASFYLPDGSYAGRYDKMHLVPFGEYTPYKQIFFFAGHLLDGLNFNPGTQRRLLGVGGHRFGVFICYESIFGDEVREFARSGAQVLVNLSDDGWYGDTSAPWEHLDMARMRAIENHRWLLRATNTGVTASIDPHGRVVAALPRHVRDAIEVPFAYQNDTTFYTQHGDWIGWLSAVLTVSFLGGAVLQRRYPLRDRPQAG